MKDELTDQQSKAILEALDEAIETGPWEESSFLRVIGKNLREIREGFANRVSGGRGSEKSRAESHLKKQTAMRVGLQEVYIALYSSEGGNIQSWERILANLPRHMISRPIYANEEAVKYLIKSKENKMNEAYVAIYINESDILAVSPDKTIIDKFGKPLMNLKDKTLNLENISRFVHMLGVYHYHKGRLIKNTPTDSE